MKLSGNQAQSFQEALLDAFTPADLRRMVRYQLDENLDAIVGGNNQTEVVFNLIEWARTQGRLAELVNGATTANPGNPRLQAWVAGHSPAQVGTENASSGNITVGDITNASSIAIGPDAQVNITNIYDGHQPADSDPVSGSNDHPREVFISYAWGGESEATVDQLEAAFQAKQIPIIRDKNDVKYKASIRDFMRRLGQGNCVIIVISKHYLTSRNCMFELTEIAKQNEFSDRVFPIVLGDAAIYDPVDRIQYIQHWEAEIKRLEEAMASVSPANMHGFRDSIDLYVKIRNTIASLIDVLADMNTLNPSAHQDNNFAALITAVEEKLAQS